MSELGDLVADLRGKATESGVKLLEERGPGWIDKALDKTVELARDAGLDPNEAALAIDAAEVVREHKGALTGVAVDAFRNTMALAWDGQIDAARRAFLETEASYDERRAAMQAGTDATYKDRVEREAAWAELADMFEEIGKMALKALVPILLAAAGL